MAYQKLSKSFYERADVTEVSKDLLGKVLCTSFNNKITAGLITETEAYCGRDDKACHANNGTRTKRTEVMYGPGGTAYVYLCYGIHHLFNVVTNREELADAVLIRAVKPIEGTNYMKSRRGKVGIDETLTAGPGRLTEALGISTDHSGTDLTGNTIWIENRGKTINNRDIEATPRIGVDYAGDDALRPWRFIIKESSWIS